MQNLGYKVIPTQLFEAIFLTILFCVFVYRIRHRKGYNLPLYMISYAIWRFFAEYLRKDYRGETLVDFLTPSQFIAVLMVVAGVILFVIMKKSSKKKEAIISEEGSANE